MSKKKFYRDDFVLLIDVAAMKTLKAAREEDENIKNDNAAFGIYTLGVLNFNSNLANGSESEALKYIYQNEDFEYIRFDNLVEQQAMNMLHKYRNARHLNPEDTTGELAYEFGAYSKGVEDYAKKICQCIRICNNIIRFE